MRHDEAGHPFTSVGIVVTTYNHAAYLPAAVESALGQTRPADQVMVIDDGSTDSTAEVLSRLPPVVDVIRQPNRGVIAARNSAIGSLKTSHVVFLDADDVLDRNFLAATTRALRKHDDPSVAVVYTSYRLAGELHGTRRPKKWDPRRLANYNYVPNTALLQLDALRRVGGYRPAMELVGHEDWELFLALAEQGFRGIRVRRPLFTYRVSSTSRNAASLERVRELRAVVERLHPWTAAPPKYSVLERLLLRLGR